jgi:malate dehydrogenase (oxaloacetate-decarboxylating)
MDKVYEDSLRLHKENKGKIEIKSKVLLRDKNDLSLAYTPGVGQVCREIAEHPETVYDYTLKANTVAIVSDGSAILGLGNLGAKAAIPVMEGKALLFKEFAGLDAFPICLDTQDNEEIIRTVKNIAPVFGGINLEDITAPRCFAIEERLRAELDIPVMHDDQHGTAVVVLAGLINSLKLTGLAKEKAKVIVNGMGAAGTAVIKILVEYGFKHILVCDSKGIVQKSRGDLNEGKIKLLDFIEQKTSQYEKLSGGLIQAIAGRDIFIGVSKGNLLTPEMVRLMGEKPVIFALANPVPEIMPDLAKDAGAYIVATGRSDFANQINNVLAFPGIFKGAFRNKIKQFEERMFLQAAENLAGYVSDLSVDKILPNPFDKGVVEAVAEAFK